MASFESIKTTSWVKVVKYHTLDTLLSETYFEPCQTFKMGFFLKLFYDF